MSKKPSRGKPAATPANAIESHAARELPALGRWILLACVFLLSSLPFLPALGQGFISWDDDIMLQNNPNWRGLSELQLTYMFTTTDMGHYQPLSWLSYAVEYSLWGLNPERMHLVNMLLHALNAVLVLRLATRLFAWSGGVAAGSEPMSAWIGGAAAALLFAVHPLRVESVAWATERRDVLSTFFLLSTVLCWLRTRDGSGARHLWWAATLACYALSLLSKAWGMTLPALLFLLEIFPLRSIEPTLKSWGLRLLSLWPFVPLAAACAWKAMQAQASFSAAVPWSEHGLMNRIAQASWGSAFYVWKTFLPLGLSPLYELEEQFDPFQRGYVIAMVFCAVLTLALLLARKRFPGGLSAWFAFLILVSPVLGLSQSGAQKAADRYTYIACMPFAVLAGAGLAALLEKRAARGARDPVLGSAALALLLACSTLGVMANAQTRVWKDSESLWRRVVAVEPESYIAHHNLAAALGPRGQLAEAIELEKRSVELRPGKGNILARHYLGSLHMSTGQPDLALAAWIEAFHVDPEFAGVISSLDQAFLRRGERARLYALFDAALAKNPGLLGTRMEYAARLAAEARAGDAEAQYKAVLAVNPRHVPALVALGRMYVIGGRVRDAEPLLVQATRLNSRNADALSELGAIRIAQGQKDAAFLLWNQALMWAPNHPRTMALVRQYGGQ